MYTIYVVFQCLPDKREAFVEAVKLICLPLMYTRVRHLPEGSLLVVIVVTSIG